MPNELRTRSNMVSGALTAQLDIAGTVMTSPGLATLPVIDATNSAAITLFVVDSSGRILAYEVVKVTAHAAGASTATVVRAQEGTAAQTWLEGSRWTHSWTAVDAANVARGMINYVQVEANQASITTAVDLTGLSVLCYVGASRRIRISAQCNAFSTVAGDVILGRIQEGATNLGVFMRMKAVAANEPYMQSGSVSFQPSAGAHTYKLTLARENGTGTVTMGASSTNPAFILVEDIGPALGSV